MSLRGLYSDQWQPWRNSLHPGFQYIQGCAVLAAKVWLTKNAESIARGQSLLHLNDAPTAIASARLIGNRNRRGSAMRGEQLVCLYLKFPFALISADEPLSTLLIEALLCCPVQ